MGKQYSYEQIANNIELWNEYVNTDANMTDDEFEALSIDERIAIQVACFGADEYVDTDATA